MVHIVLILSGEILSWSLMGVKVFGVMFLICTFSYGHLILVSIFYQLTFEKNQVHTADDLKHCRQILKLIKFYMKGNRGN